MNVRPATPYDVPILQDLWIEFVDDHTRRDPSFGRREGAEDRWGDYARALIDDEAWCVLVAEIDGAVVAYLTATVQEYPPVFTVDKYGFLQEILVTRIHRRRGIARELVRRAEEWLRARGVPQTQVRVDSANATALDFWARCGFTAHTRTLVKKYTDTSA